MTSQNPAQQITAPPPMDGKPEQSLLRAGWRFVVDQTRLMRNPKLNKRWRSIRKRQKEREQLAWYPPLNTKEEYAAEARANEPFLSLWGLNKWAAWNRFGGQNNPKYLSRAYKRQCEYSAMRDFWYKALSYVILPVFATSLMTTSFAIAVMGTKTSTFAGNEIVIAQITVLFIGFGTLFGFMGWTLFITRKWSLAYMKAYTFETNAGLRKTANGIVSFENGILSALSGVAGYANGITAPAIAAPANGSAPTNGTGAVHGADPATALAVPQNGAAVATALIDPENDIALFEGEYLELMDEYGDGRPDMITGVLEAYVPRLAHADKDHLGDYYPGPSGRSGFLTANTHLALERGTYIHELKDPRLLYVLKPKSHTLKRIAAAETYNLMQLFAEIGKDEADLGKNKLLKALQEHWLWIFAGFGALVGIYMSQENSRWTMDAINAMDAISK